MPSPDLAVDPAVAERLVAEGFLRREERPEGVVSYRLTARGIAEAREIFARHPQADAMRRQVNRLLDEIERTT